MTAIIAGQGLGLLNTSLNLLGAQGQLGNAVQGNQGEKVYINASNGNLMVQQQDEWLVGVGPDVGVVRTYNSQNGLSDPNVNHNWRLGYSRMVYVAAGTPLTSPVNGVTTVTRIAEDGSQTVYTYNAAQGKYIGHEGSGSLDTLSYNSGTQQWTWTDGATRTQEFYDGGNGGRLVRVQDASGHKLTISYVGLLIDTIADDNGETVKIEYDANNNLKDILTTYKDGNGTLNQLLRRVSYLYDTSNRLSKVTVALGANISTSGGLQRYTGGGASYATTYTYVGTSNLLETITEGDNTKLSFTYYADNRIQTATDGRGNITKFEYTTGVTKVTDANQQVTTLTYDTGTQQLLSIAQPTVNGFTPKTTFTYLNGEVSTVTDARGGISTYRYDTNSNRIYEQDGAGRVLTRTFDANNQVLTQTVYTTSAAAGATPASGGQVTRHVYDGVLLRFKVSPEGRVTEYRYGTVAGQLSSSIVYAGNLYPVATIGSALQLSDLNTWLNQTGAGKIDKTRTERTDYGYDGRGQIQTKTIFDQVQADGTGLLNGQQSVTHYIYDQTGNLLQSVDARNTTNHLTNYVTNYAYDGLNRITYTTDGLGNTRMTVWTDQFSTISMVSEVAADNSTRYSYYNSAGLLTSTDTDVNSNRSYVYDKLNRLVQITDPTGRKEFNLYDADSRLVAHVDSTAGLTEYIYNGNGQVVKTIVYANKVTAPLSGTGFDPKVLTLDGTGGLRPALNPANDRISYNLYDAAGQLSMTVDPAGAVIESRYDGSGRLNSTIAYNVVLTAAQFTSLGNTTAELKAGTGTITTTSTSGTSTITLSLDATNDRRSRNFYSDDGLLVGQLDANGYLTQNTYDAAGRLIKATRFATPTDSSYRASGTLSQLIPVNGGNSASDQTTFYVYNAKGQLAGMLDAENYYTAYQYDLAGNQSSQKRHAQTLKNTFDGFTPPVVVDIVANPQAALPTTGSYVVTDKEDRQLQSLYDANNRLLKTTSTPDGVVTDYVYDSVGNLLSTKQTAYVQAQGLTETRVQTRQYDELGQLTAELSGEGSAALATLKAGTPAPSQAQINALWAQYGTRHQYDLAGRRIATIVPDGVDGAGNKTVYYYDGASRLTYAINALGEVNAYQYNAFGDQTKQTRYGTRLSQTVLATLAGGLDTDSPLQTALSGLANASLDSVNTTTYDGRGQALTLAAAISSTLQDTSSRTYTTFGQLLTETTGNNGNSLTTTYFYDQRGAQVRKKDLGQDGLNRNSFMEYDAFGRVSNRIDNKFNATKFTYDRLGRTITSTDKKNIQDLTSYDAFDRVLTYKDRTGQITTYAYDTTLGTMTVTTPENVSTVTSTNHLGQTVRVKDGLGTITTYSYNRDGQLLQTQVAPSTSAQRTTKTDHDHAGRVLDTIDANGIKTVYTYDAANRVLSRTVDPNPTVADGKTHLNLVTKYLYDAKGQAQWTRDANGVWTRTDYDLKGQVKLIAVDPTNIPDASDPSKPLVFNSNAANLQTAYTYDADGHTLTVTEGAGSTAARTTRYVFDSAGRRIQEIVDPKASAQWPGDSATGLNLVTKYTYDFNDNVVAKTDANGQITRYVYDTNNRLYYTVDPTGAVISTRYDNNGQLISRRAYATPLSTAEFGLEISAVDVLNGLEIYPAGDQATFYVYNKDGQRTFAVDALGSVQQWMYDKAGHVVAVKRYANALQSTYVSGVAPQIISATAPTPANGSYVRQSENDQFEQTVYEQGRATFHIDAAGYATQYSYDANGNVVKTTRYAKPMAIVGSSSRELATGQVPIVGTSTTAGVAFIALAQATDTSQDATSYTYYDSANRAVLSVDAENYLTQRTYSATGQLTTTRFATKLSNTAQLSSGQPPQALASAPTGTPAWAWLVKDINADASTRNAYDRAGRLLDATDAEGVVTHYYYDACGRVTFKTQNINPPEADPILINTGYAYDSAGRLIEETLGYLNPKASSTRYVLDALGQRINIIDPRGVEAAEGTGTWAISERKRILGDSVDRTLPAIKDSADYKTLLKAYTTVQEFDANGRLWRSTSPAPLNIVITTEFDAFGNAVKVIDPAGGIGYFYFDQLNRATWHVDPTNYATQTTYNGLGEVSSIRKYVSVVQKPELLNTATPPAIYTTGALPSGTYVQRQDDVVTGDQITEIKHDLLGRQTKVTDASGHAESMTYDAFGNKTTHTNKLGGITQNQYDRVGNLVQETLPEKVKQYDGDNKVVMEGSLAKLHAVVNKYTYDARGNRLTGIEAYQLKEQRKTTYTYDHLDRLTSQASEAMAIYPAALPGQTGTPGEIRHYDARGNLIEVIAANGGRTLSYYDVINRKVAEVSPTGTLSIFTYNSGSDLVTVRVFGDVLDVASLTAGGYTPSPIDAANVRQTQYTYDAAHRQLTSTVKAIQVGDVNPTTGNYEVKVQDLLTQKQYDRAGNVVAETDARGNTTWYYHDKLGHRILQVDAERYVTKWIRDANGNVTNELRYAQKLPDSVTVNANSVPLTLTNALGTTDARETLFVRDKMGRVLTQTVVGVKTATVSGTVITPVTDNAVTRFTYDDQGNVVEKQEASQAILNWVYDLQGRQTESKGERFTDDAGSINQRQITALEYNGLGLTTRTIERAKSASDDRVTFTKYGLNGLASSETDALGNVTSYQYDVAGNVTLKSITRLDSLQAASTDITTYQYDLTGRQKLQSIYNVTGRDAALPAAATALQTQEVKYNAYGEVEGKSTNGAWQEFAEYDKAGRAVKSNAGSGITKAYLFDANGNVSMTIESTGAVDLKSLTMDQILRRNDLFTTITAHDRRNLLTDTYQAKQKADGNQAWQNAALLDGGNGVLINASSSASAPANAAVPDLMARGDTITLQAELLTLAGTPKIASFPATSTYGNVGFVTIGGVTATIIIPDTTLMGTGPVSIWMETLGGKPITSTVNEYAGKLRKILDDDGNPTDSYDGYNGLNASPLTRHLLGGSNDTTALAKVVNLGATLLKNGMLSSLLHVTKKVNGQDVELLKPISITFKDGPTPTIALGTVETAPSVLALNNQSRDATQLVLNYRAKNSTDAWTVRTPNKGTLSASGDTQFWLPTLDGLLPVGTYEMRYAVLGGAGNVLNAEEGTIQVSAKNITFSKAPRQVIASAGQVFGDTQGNLNVSEQGANAVKATWTITPAGGGASTTVQTSPVQLNGQAVPGWFQLPRQDTQITNLPPGPYNFTFTSFWEDGTTVIQKVAGSFSKDGTGLKSETPPTLVQAPTGLIPRGSFSSTTLTLGSMSGLPVRTSYPAQSSATNAIYNHVAYSGISGITANLVIPDTSALGPGSVIVERVALNPKNINDLLKELPVSTMGNIFDDDGNVIG
ncbi:MAG: hypothetical protein EOP36_06545, partial [Rubrivivax sp.]